MHRGAQGLRKTPDGNTGLESNFCLESVHRRRNRGAEGASAHQYQK